MFTRLMRQTVSKKVAALPVALAALLAAAGSHAQPKAPAGKAPTPPAAKAAPADAKAAPTAPKPAPADAKAAPTPPAVAAPAQAPKVATPAAAAAAPGRNDEAARALAARIATFYGSVEGMQANFTQVVRKKGLKKGIQRKGTVWLKKGNVLPPTKAGEAPTVENGRMRWDYPDEEVFYYSDGDILWTYERRERVALRLPVKDSRLYQATGYLLGQGDLAKDFDLLAVPSTLPGTQALELHPKDGTAVMQKLTLVLDVKTGAVVASILIDPLGDSTSLFFKDLTYGPQPNERFAWKPPAGVSIRTP